MRGPELPRKNTAYETGRRLLSPHYVFTFFICSRIVNNDIMWTLMSLVGSNHSYVIQIHVYYRYTKGHFAPAIRIELMSTVLETAMLPLHQAGCVALIQNYDIWTPKLTASCSASELNQRL